jgi:16S rRNA (cytosine1402-N4)-methyltransferase
VWKAGEHAPVLLEEVLEGLAVRADGTYLDGTYGRGGHGRAVLDRLGPKGRLLTIDRDPDAVASARKDLAADSRVRIEQGNFAEMGAISATAGFEGGFDGILLDLGVSSPQLDQPHRGFSFLSDGPLDMRMDPSQPLTAAGWINTASEREIGDVIRRYGEDRFARRIARAIVARRAQERIESTGRLAEVVSGAIPVRAREPGKHPATRTFQAIRIHVNDELGALDRGLEAALDLLRTRGRLCVISFHSLEDRMVKRFMRRNASEDEAWRGLPDVPAHARARIALVGKAIRPARDEMRRNPRARSAVLRVAEKVA